MTKEEIRDKCIDAKWPLDGSSHDVTRNRLAKVSSWGVEYKMMDEYYNQAIDDMTVLLKRYFGPDGFMNLESLHPKIEALKKPLQGHAK